MLIAATPGDNAGLEFDLCRRNGGCLLQPVGGLDSNCAALGAPAARSPGSLRVARTGSSARGCPNKPCAVRAALTMNNIIMAALALESYRPLAVQYNAAVLIAFWSGGSVYR